MPYGTESNTHTKYKKLTSPATRQQIAKWPGNKSLLKLNIMLAEHMYSRKENEHRKIKMSDFPIFTAIAEKHPELPIEKLWRELYTGHKDHSFWNEERIIADSKAMKGKEDAWQAPYEQYKNVVCVRDTDRTTTAYGEAQRDKELSQLQGKEILFSRSVLGGTEYFFN